MTVVVVPQLRDNYAYLLVDEAHARAAAIDVAEAGPIEEALAARGLALEALLSTHHHPDHTGGNAALAEAHPGLRVLGAASDAARIPALTEGVRDGDLVRVAGHEVRVRFVPCHTRGHVVYVTGLEAFTGDTLFSGGCGRFFEGSAADMYHALYEVLGTLPDATRVWCGHEYTAQNLAFAAELEPQNEALAARRLAVEALRGRGEPTVPALLGEERGYNPFLRVHLPVLAEAVAARSPGLDVRDPVVVLGALRALKDGWR